MSNTSIEAFKWTTDATELLIRLIKSNYVKLNSGVKKATYMRIANTINDGLGTDLTHCQIESKWKGLKRTYKKIRNYAYATGRTRPWEFYDQIEEILCADLEPLPDVLSIENIKKSDESALDFVAANDEVDSEPEYKQEYHEAPSRKRRYVEIDAREDAIERRHRERIEVANRFNDIFEEMVRKM